MSAVFALLNRDGTPIDRALASRLHSLMDYRGSDSRSLVVRDNLALGYQHFGESHVHDNRQPIMRGGSLLAIGGRIDNRRELRRLLSKHLVAPLGILSDAELVLALYNAAGPSALADLDGDYAIVIWDAARKSLLCLRDKLGVCPLFYYADSHVFVAASDPSPILGHPRVRLRPNESVLLEFLTGRRVSPEMSFYDGLGLVPRAGCVTATGRQLQVYRYWAPIIGREQASFDEASEELAALLDRAVRRRLKATSPVVCQLSGGIDSSVVTICAARLLSPERVGTVSVVFDEYADCDERVYIEEVERAYDLHCEYVLGDSLWTLREPHVYDALLQYGPQQDATALLMRACYARVAGAGSRIVLTGIGGELAEASYAEYRQVRSIERFRLFLSHMTRTREASQAAWRLLVRYWLLPLLPPRLLALGDVPTPAEKALIHCLQDAFVDTVRQVAAEEREPDLFVIGGGRPVPVDLHSSLADIELATHSALALRCGVVLRHPFLDPSVVEFLMAAAPQWRLRYGFQKAIMREALRPHLPGRIRSRSTKAHLDGLVTVGLLHKERWRIEQLAQQSELVARGYAHQGRLAKVIQTALNARGRRMTQEGWLVILWRLVATELWFRWMRSRGG